METLVPNLCNTGWWLVIRRIRIWPDGFFFGGGGMGGDKKKKSMPPKAPLLFYVFLNDYVIRVLKHSTETPLVMKVQFRPFLDLNKLQSPCKSMTNSTRCQQRAVYRGSVSWVWGKFLGEGNTEPQMHSRIRGPQTDRSQPRPTTS